MNVSGGYTLTDEQIANWQATYSEEYDEYLEFWDGDHTWSELPEWATDEDATTGPFDFSVNASHETSGW